MFFKGVVVLVEDWRVRTAGAKAPAPVINKRGAASESLMVVVAESVVFVRILFLLVLEEGLLFALTIGWMIALHAG